VTCVIILLLLLVLCEQEQVRLSAKKPISVGHGGGMGTYLLFLPTASATMSLHTWR
jgi:hypothetical protein